MICKTAAIALLSGLVLASEPSSPGPLENGRSYTSWFYAGETGKLWERFLPDMQKAMGAREGLDGFRKQVAAQLGSETAILDEQVRPLMGLQVYTRTASFEKYPGPITVQWTFDEKGMVGGFFVRPEQKEAASAFLNYETKTVLHLPFKQEWHVFWGGRSVAENYHSVTTDQRFAYDILISREGKSHGGDGTKNEHYFCFGEPILAPAEGSVVEAVDDIPDNVPGRMNPSQPLGNHVILDHGNGEFSFLAHLQKGSVQVQKGAKVAAGSILGRCGNSGNSSEPHLHYHLQTTAVFGQGKGLPAQFQGYFADGKEVERGEPSRGQTIRNK